MQRLEVSGAVRPIYGSLGVKGLIKGAEKSLAQPGRKQAAPVKSVMGRGMD